MIKNDEYDILSPGSWENECSSILGDWFAVANSTGIVAYFGNENDAWEFIEQKRKQ